ncbi:MAG: 4Fe-4S ferredoxin [Sphaerochaetaceae bacterium]
MHAARNIALCTKDCLCLFVCPTGATDTETGQIDFAKCLDGCRLCVDACPSHAIYLVYDTYAPKPAKDEKLVAALDRLLESKVKQETKASSLADTSKLAKALALSNRILAEDCARESRYMLPQGEGAKDLLLQIKEQEKELSFSVEPLLHL